MEFQKYFQAYEDYFWEWDNGAFDPDEGSNSISITNGQTIAYEQLIFEFLETLSDDCIPPFGTLLLAIIATNPASDDAIEMVYNLAKSKEKKSAFPNANLYKTGVAIDFMKLLAKLPEEYKKGDKRKLVFSTIFHDCHNRIGSEKAKKLVFEYKNYRHHLLRASQKIPFNDSNFVKDVRTLALLKTSFPTTQSIIDALQSLPKEEIVNKLDEEVVEQDIVSDKPKDFIDELIEEDKTFHVGSLIKRIWSGLNIPLHHNSPSEQPLGGISDLTNKGDFDKLLLSEFAQDDDVFMSRIANNEALYIQREVPPESDKFERVILIDSSLKNWGNSRILNFATALAIAKHPKTDIECRLIALGAIYNEVYYTDVDEVIDGLNLLSPKLDCSEGLNKYIIDSQKNTEEQELFFITSEDSLKLQPILKVINEHFDKIKYIVITNTDGVINFYKNQNKGRKHIQKMVLPLEELWKRKKVNKKKKTSKKREAITNDFPLLYPVERSYHTIFKDSDSGYYNYINDELFQFSSSFEKGYYKIADNLPFGTGKYILKINYLQEIILYHYDGNTFSSYNLKTKELIKSRIITFNINEIYFFNYKNVIYFFIGQIFYIIKDDLTVEITRSISNDVFNLYYSDLDQFIKRFKKSKVKYNVLKNVLSINVNELEHSHQNKYFIHINNYYFSTTSFVIPYSISVNYKYDFFQKVNLILKSQGSKPENVIKELKSNSNYSLKKCSDIVYGDLETILKDVTLDKAEFLKGKLEKEGAICYIENECFEYIDGSKITNKEGILVFESSNANIPVFYIPFVNTMESALISETEFSGNEYFYNKEYQLDKISIDSFYDKYINPFFNNLKEFERHGA
jgi:hypothetical protein